MADINLTNEEILPLLTKIKSFIEENRTTLEPEGTYNDIEFWISGYKVTSSYTGIMTIESAHRATLLFSCLPDAIASLGLSIFTLLREILDEQTVQRKKQFLEGFGL